MATAIRTARARARDEVTREIVAEARRQLAVVGPAALSLRAVARELGMVSSGVYRYVASRDDLLTRLIVEAYDALGERAETTAATTRASPPAERFVATCRAIRAWALEHPHEYALVYGTPVPGYEAPADTVGPASRTSLALVGIVADADLAGRLDRTPAPPVAVPPELAGDLATLLADTGLAVPAESLLRLLAAWTQVFGLISFELFGQTNNVVHDHAALFDATTRAMAAFVGLGVGPDANVGPAPESGPDAEGRSGGIS